MIRAVLITGAMIAFVSYSGSAEAAPCPVPHAIANGQLADATKVMDNFTAIANCAQQALTTTGTPIAGSLPVFSGAGIVSPGNLTGDISTAGGTNTTLSDTGVTPGIYLNANITVDSKGRLTSATNGNGGGGGSGGSGPTLIQQYVASGSTGTYDFTIPSSFLSLDIEIIGRSTYAGSDVEPILLTFNNDGLQNYQWVRYGLPPNSSSSTGANANSNVVIGYLPAASAASGSVGTYSVHIPHYLSSLQKAGDSSGHGVGVSDMYATTHGFAWTGTAAINHLKVSLANGNFAAGSVIRAWGQGSSAIPAKYGAHRYWRMSAIANASGENNVIIAEMKVLDYYNNEVVCQSVVVDADLGGSYGGANMIDGNTQTIWAGPGPNSHYVVLDFGVAVDPRALSITTGAHPDWPIQGPKTFNWEYSDDGTSWHSATSVTAGNYYTNAYQSILIP